MSAYRPILKLGCLLPAQTQYCDKIGGLPWGLPPQLWPECRSCGSPLSFNAQFRAHEKRLPQLRPAQVLFAFSCDHDPGMCETWDAQSGANAVLILHETELTRDLTPPPDTQTSIEPEGRVAGWNAVSNLGIHSGIGREPRWLQAPEPTGDFLLQLSDFHYMEGPIPTSVEVGCEVLDYRGASMTISRPPGFQPLSPPEWRRGQLEFPGRPSQLVVNKDLSWGCETANFGGGLAYIFLTDAENSALMLIQR